MGCKGSEILLKRPSPPLVSLPSPTVRLLTCIDCTVQMHLGHSSIHLSPNTQSPKAEFAPGHFSANMPPFPQLPPHRINSWKLLHEQRGPSHLSNHSLCAYSTSTKLNIYLQYSVQGLHAGCLGSVCAPSQKQSFSTCISVSPNSSHHSKSFEYHSLLKTFPHPCLPQTGFISQSSASGIISMSCALGFVWLIFISAMIEGTVQHLGRI